MKHIALTFILMLGIVSVSTAAPAVPDARVYIAPTDAKPGEPITLNAFVYNTETQDVTVTVSFTAGENEVAHATLLVPQETAKVATTSWTMPEKATVIVATVTKAMNKQKKDIAALHGKLGTVTVGTTAPLSKIAIPRQVKGWFGSLVFRLETFRAAQQAHFATIRDNAKDRLGLTVQDAAKKLLNPEVPAPLPAEDTPGEEVQKEHHDPMDYATLIYSTLLAGFFANKAVFYIVLVILVLFVIRFIVGRFS